MIDRANRLTNEIASAVTGKVENLPKEAKSRKETPTRPPARRPLLGHRSQRQFGFWYVVAMHTMKYRQRF